MELLMNEQTMKIITAGAMAYAAYRGIKKIEKVFNNRATERERIIELQLKEEERRLAKEERKRIIEWTSTSPTIMAATKERMLQRLLSPFLVSSIPITPSNTPTKSKVIFW